MGYMNLDSKYLFSKGFEIIYQQMLIVVLVFVLKDAGLNLFMITLIFTIVFGFGHLAALVLYKGLFGYFIFIASILPRVGFG